MDESFIVTIPYGSDRYDLETKIVWSGYQHRIEILVEEILVYFEPDEERHYRALIPGQPMGNKVINQGLLEAIARYLEDILAS